MAAKYLRIRRVVMNFLTVLLLVGAVIGTAPMTSAEVLEVMDEYGRDVVIEIAEQETPLSSSDLVVQPTSTYTMHSTAASQPVIGANARLSEQHLVVNGKYINRGEIYNIGGYNYFKLRDIAYLLNGTDSEFSVEWDPTYNAIRIKTFEPYTPNGEELTEKNKGRPMRAEPSSQKLIIDDIEVTGLSVYNIGGYNYFKLRDLGDALNFFVGYKSIGNLAIIVTLDHTLDPDIDFGDAYPDGPFKGYTDDEDDDDPWLGDRGPTVDADPDEEWIVNPGYGKPN